MPDQAQRDASEGAMVKGGYDPTQYDPPKNPRRTASHTQSLDEEPVVKAKYSKEESMNILGYQDAPGFGYVAHKAEKRARRTFQVPRDRLRMLLIPIVLALMVGIGGVASAVQTMNGYSKRVTSLCSTTSSAGNVCNAAAFDTTFLDANFSAVCGVTGSSAGVPVVQSVTKSLDSATGFEQVVINISNLTAAVATPTEVSCVFSHD